jgi:hypothetical protein
MDRTCGAQCVVRSLDGRWVNSGAILATWMTSDDNDHLGQNDRQVKLYKPMFNRTADLVMEPIRVILQ